MSLSLVGKEGDVSDVLTVAAKPASNVPLIVPALLLMLISAMFLEFYSLLGVTNKVAILLPGGRKEH